MITSKNKTFSLISVCSINCRSLDNLMELLGLFIGLGLLKLKHLIYPRVSTWFGLLIFFTNLSVMEFLLRYLASFPLFSVIDAFEWFWMGGLHKNIQLMLDRSSRAEVFCKKSVLKNIAKFTGKHLCQSLFFKKVVADWDSVNFAKFLRAPFL